MKRHLLCMGLVAGLGVPLVLLAAPAIKPVAAPKVVAEETLRSFHPGDFALAFDVLVGAGDLPRAFLVAEKAVAELPHDLVWRKKLARVSEWIDNTEVAAAQWLVLFKAGDHSAEAISAVLRLAPLIDEPMVALQAWAVLARQKPLTDAQWQDVYNLYESAAEPAQGSLFFADQFATSHNLKLLEYAAILAEHAGDDTRAQQLYLQRAQLTPFSLEMVLRAVLILIRGNQLPQALALMQAHAHQVDDSHAEFWQLLSQVAWELRAYDRAREAYARYARLPQAVAADWERLLYLVRREHPGQAADLALEAYRRFGSTEMLMLGLELYAEVEDGAAQARVYASLSAQSLETLTQNPRFLSLRAQFHQRQKEPELAWADLSLALRLNPQDQEMVLAALWFLIDHQKTDVLSVLMAQYATKAGATPEYWAAYAAGHQVLEQHRDAAHWYGKLARTQDNDPLLLLNYADTLERINQTGMADRVRRHAWLLLKDKYPKPELPRDGKLNADLLALARLSLLNQPGDPGLVLVRQLVSQLRGVPAAGQDEQTLALVLGWSIVKEQFGNARAWMWRRYARQAHLVAPLWGQSQTALQLRETDTMIRLLTRQADALPIYNRYDIARELGHVDQALSVAFAGMSAQDDEPLYDRFRQHAPAQANYLQIGGQVHRQGALDTQGLQFETRLVINSRLQLVLNWSRQLPTSTDPLLSALAPSADQLGSAKIQWQGPRGSTSLALLRRSAQTGMDGFRVTQSHQWSAHLTLDAGLSFRVDSTASQPLRLAGYESNIFAGVNYALGKREYVRVAPRFSRYYTQWGDLLGSGQALDLEVGYRFRTEYPDWRVRTFASWQRFSSVAALGAESLVRLPESVQSAVANNALDPVAYFMPTGSVVWGACLGMGDNLAGQNLQETYSRAWRPFGDLCFNHNTSSVSGVLGIAGSVSGEDHLLLQWQSSDGTGSGGAAANTLFARYRRYF